MNPPLRAAILACALAAAGVPAPAQEAPAPAVTTRRFETRDLERARRVALATLQDLGFALESGDPETGTLTASRLDQQPLRLSVTIAAQGDAISATVSADYASKALADPHPAEQFLAAYQAALFPPPEIE